MLQPISYLLLSATLIGVAVADDATKPVPAHTMPAATVPMDAVDTAKQVFMKNMMHANPLPNYMVIINKQADTLKLSDEQKAKVNAWYNENNPKAAEAVKNIVAAEQALAQASMDGASLETIMKQFDEMIAMRRALAEQKTKCRDHMQAILTPEQWGQVVSMQREALASK